MSRTGTWSLILIIIGVLANNYIYLHDVVFGKYEVAALPVVEGRLPGFLVAVLPNVGSGVIVLGTLSYVGIIIAFILIVIGLVLAGRVMSGSTSG